MAKRGAVPAATVYLGVSFLYFGLPLVAHPRRDWIGSGADPQIFVWSLAWWPHALLHWENPVVTHAVWPPVGLDLAWVSSIPALAAVFAPVTLAAGPVVAYNAAAVLMPAVGAWTAFLLCRQLTRSFWPSLAAGYLFGFSSYELGHLQGHMHLSSVFLVPLVALLIVRFVDGSLDGGGLVLRLGPVLAAQVLLSTEILFTLTLSLAVAWIAAFALLAAHRPRIKLLWRPLAGAYLVAGVLASPLLAYALTDFHRASLNEPRVFSADLLNLAVPTRLTAVAPDWARRIAVTFHGNDAENGAYLGLPLLAIVAWFAWQRWRDATARLLLVLLALAVVAELGPYLRVRGATYAPLPWKPLVDRPLLNDVLPVRFSLYAALAAAVIAALWAAGSAPAWARIGLAAAAIAATAPALGHGYWHGEPHRPAFFARGLDRVCLPAKAVLLALPYPSQNEAMLWQAEAAFRFRLADAWLSPVVPDGVPLRTVAEALHDNDPPAGGGGAIVRLARAQGADAIMVDREHAQPWRALLARTGLRARTVGGVDLYELRGTLGSCRSRSGRPGASSTSSRSTSARGASSASPSRSSCSSAESTRSSCSTASRTPQAT